VTPAELLAELEQLTAAEEAVARRGARGSLAERRAAFYRGAAAALRQAIALVDEKGGEENTR
jgi:hypothetical protein